MIKRQAEPFDSIIALSHATVESALLEPDHFSSSKWTPYRNRRVAPQATDILSDQNNVEQSIQKLMQCMIGCLLPMFHVQANYSISQTGCDAITNTTSDSTITCTTQLRVRNTRSSLNDLKRARKTRTTVEFGEGYASDAHNTLRDLKSSYANNLERGRHQKSKGCNDRMIVTYKICLGG